MSAQVPAAPATMIYFLVNNDYQLLDARHHAAELRRQGLATTLVEIPHKLSESAEKSEFDTRLRLDSPVHLQGPLRRWAGYMQAAGKVSRRLKPQAADTLFIYTEYELLNHFVAHGFKRAGARVFILEDGGVGTYIPFTLPGDEALSTREKIVAAMTRCLPGLRHTRFHKVNGIVFPWMQDHQIDGLCTYRPLSIVRDIPVTVLRAPARKKITVRPGCVIFMNQPLYDDYQTEADYFQGLRQVAHALEAGFDEVLFKFHPRETPAWTERIAKFLADQAPTVKIIQDNGPAENLLENTRPAVVASYFSTTLLNLDGTGIEPLFVYHLLPDLAPQKVMRQLTTLLNQWSYHFVSRWEDVNSGYASGMARLAAASCIDLAGFVVARHGGHGSSDPRAGISAVHP